MDRFLFHAVSNRILSGFLNVLLAAYVSDWRLEISRFFPPGRAEGLIPLHCRRSETHNSHRSLYLPKFPLHWAFPVCILSQICPYPCSNPPLNSELSWSVCYPCPGCPSSEYQDNIPCIIGANTPFKIKSPFAAFQQLFQEKYDLIFLWSFAMSFRKSKEKKEKIITQWYNTVVAKNIKKYGAQVFSFVIQL